MLKLTTPDLPAHLDRNGVPAALVADSPLALPAARLQPTGSTGVFFFFTSFCGSFPSSFQRVTCLQGVIWDLGSVWCCPTVNAWPDFIAVRLIRPSMVNWSYMLLIMATGSFCFSTIFFLFFLCHPFFPLHVTRRAVFGISFHGSSFCFFRVDVGRHPEVHWGE